MITLNLKENNYPVCHNYLRVTGDMDIIKKLKTFPLDKTHGVFDFRYLHDIPSNLSVTNYTNLIKSETGSRAIPLIKPQNTYFDLGSMYIYYHTILFPNSGSIKQLAGWLAENCEGSSWRIDFCYNNEEHKFCGITQIESNPRCGYSIIEHNKFGYVFLTSKEVSEMTAGELGELYLKCGGVYKTSADDIHTFLYRVRELLGRPEGGLVVCPLAYARVFHKVTVEEKGR